MIKTFLEKFSLFLFLLIIPLSIFSMDDSDIFLDSVFINAVQKGDLEKVKKMIADGISKSEKKIALNNKDSEGMVALAYALKSDNSNMFHLLLEGGANINIPVLEGKSLLIFYVSNNRFALIDDIINGGVNINSQDKLGRTALMISIETRNFKAVQALYKKKIDITMTDFGGKTIFDYAEKCRDNRIKSLINEIKSM